MKPTLNPKLMASLPLPGPCQPGCPHELSSMMLIINQLLHHSHQTPPNRFDLWSSYSNTSSLSLWIKSEPQGPGHPCFSVSLMVLLCRQGWKPMTRDRGYFFFVQSSSAWSCQVPAPSLPYQAVILKYGPQINISFPWLEILKPHPGPTNSKTWVGPSICILTNSLGNSDAHNLRTVAQYIPVKVHTP